MVPSTTSIPTITAVAFRDAERLWIASDDAGTCRLSVLRLPDRNVDAVRDLAFCPTVIIPGADGTLRLSRGTISLHLDSQGALLPSADSGSLRSGRKVRATGETIGIRRNAHGEALVKLEAGQEKQLTPDFVEIDSFDMDPREKEIVISADASEGLNIGILSVEGGEIRWIFPDSLPERLVTWAPRGSKISYVVEAHDGSIIRTVHVPTSYQLSIDFPLSSITSMAWEPAAEKFAVSLSSVDRSPRVELMKYGGEERETIYGGAVVTPGNIDRVGAAVVRTPRIVRYGHHQPLVVWVTRESPFAWNESRDRLGRESDSGLAVVSPAAVNAQLWSDLLSLPWVDKDRVFMIYNHLPDRETILPKDVAVTVIRPDGKRRSVGREKGGVVLVPASRPESAESLAVDYILGKLQKK